MSFFSKMRDTAMINVIAGVIAFVLFLCEGSIAVYELTMSGESFLATISCIVFSTLAATSLMYTLGILTRNECLLLPLLTRQVILTPLLGVFVIFWWIGAMLSYFDLVHYGSPISRFSTSEFFIIFGVILTLTFVVYAKISIVLYKGYRRLDSEVMGHLGNGYVQRSSTIPPTAV